MTDRKKKAKEILEVLSDEDNTDEFCVNFLRNELGLVGFIHPSHYEGLFEGAIAMCVEVAYE